MTDNEEKGLSRAEKRRKAKALNQYAKKVTTVTDVKKILDRYHEMMVMPRLEFLEEYVMYKRMKPWQRIYYHWLNFKGWCKARYRAFERFVYARRWDRENKKVLERMSKGETIEND